MQTINGVPWLEISQAVGSVATAGIAYFALRNWKWQDRAKREAEFLDELIDATHRHVLEMQRPIELMRMAKIGMESHVPQLETGDEAERAIAGAVNYINRLGEQEDTRFMEALTAVEPSVVKLRSLSVKGQIFKFDDYQKCFEAIMNLTWHINRLRAFASITGLPMLNWENPEIRSRLAKVMIIEPDDILQDLQAKNAIIIEFARDTYARIYG